MHENMMSELLGGGARYKALRTIFENPSKGFGARELAASAGIDPGAASRWLRRWADVGILEKVIQGRAVAYAASKSPSLVLFARFMRQDGEIVSTLRERLEGLELPVQAAAIFGSVARGDERADSDIDLLLVTEGSRLQAQAHFKPAGRKLGRAVNVLTFTPEEWVGAQSGDELVSEILKNPVTILKGELIAA